jgi:hypothetical protein
MRKSLWIIPILLLFLAISALCAGADTITFTGAPPGPLTPTGSFAYNTTTNLFTSFVVVWNGITFDLSGSANSPQIFGAGPACLAGATGAPAALALLTNCGAEAFWEALEDTTGFAQFTFAAGVSPSHPFIDISNTQTASPPPSVGFTDGGTYQVSAVPEPGTFSLMLIGVGLVLVMRKRIAQGLPQAT